MFDDLLPSDTTTIRYEETALSSLKQNPCHFKCGIYLICVQGESIISTGVEQYVFNEQTELIFLTGGLIQVIHVSADFKARLLMFPKDVFLKAMLPVDTPYFNYTHEHPYYHHTEDERSQKTWREIMLWMDVAQMLFENNTTSQFRQQQEYNFLQSLLMWLFNTIPEKLALNSHYSRKQILCHQFLQLVREYSTQEHQVTFYAEKMCISSRYLYKVTVEYLNGKTPKQVIDEQLLAEVKVLLNEPYLSVTEIAEQLNFADQSYLTRFFKKNTGMAPKEFRSRKSW
ncbi:AraC family transcriptional regulator [uncultured Bacteroides sp.]|uniref:helix-turn-helix domain-containing protein n=1 Tax=uncultured Bacteroides sp. TaxID=162156 RepID=UPI002674A0C0|nr:helix-turn-helix domain-containing protein [uncultured Bacteroides sp.]